MSADDDPEPMDTVLATSEIGVRVAASEATLQPFRLRVRQGVDAGRSFTATRDRVVIGTHASADVVLADRSVSRFHCEIAVRGGRIELRDLGSRNGTLVSGVPVLHGYLRPGLSLTVGRTTLEFDVDAGAQPLRIPLGPARFGPMVGGSLPMRAAFALLERAAASNATVLLSGETGTGKEVAAEAVHAAGARRAAPFVVVDCGAVPPDLLESELFGHERGAFTGAVSARTGAFEAAGGGTVFLDEIGELPLALQPKLLRVLEKKEIKRVGATAWQSADVRVIAATHRNLRGEVNAKTFRADLYYRLAVLEVRLPALRERVEDMPLLVEHLLGALGVAGRPEAALVRAPERLAELARHPWPGNVRELRNYVERCIALAEAVPLGEAEAAGAPEPGAGAAAGAAAGAGAAADRPLREARDEALRSFERRYLEALLERHGDNVSAAARAAGIDRKYLYRLLWRHGLR